MRGTSSNVFTARLREKEEIERRFGALQPDKGCLHAARARKEFQHRSRDDPERALRSHEEMFQLVARVVLFELPQRIQHTSVGENDFEPLHEIARIAVGEHGRAARIGREIAADGA